MVLGAVARDLRQEYGRQYRVLRADSGESALELVRDLQLRNVPVTMFFVDQRMPGMSGVAFLEEAVEIFPDAKRVLLTAYADTEAAISAINDVALNQYLMKPWGPPEENLYLGARPNTDWVADVVERDPQGFILTGRSLVRGGRRPKGWYLDRDPYFLETSVPGTFAAGDVRHRSVKRIASAVGEGSMAVQFVHQYLSRVPE